MTADTATAPRQIRPPDRAGLLRESLGLLELPRLLLAAPDLARQARGSGQPVMVLPGFGTTDASTAVLRSYLAFLGYRPSGWGLGRNTGDVPDLLERIADRVASFGRGEAPVRLVGWSLGGYLAREVARERPELVHQVVTLGSPVVGGPKYTTVAERFRSRGVDLDAIEAEVDARNARLIVPPVTAIYSRSDAVVAWQACIDPWPNPVEHVEVETTHVGLGFSPEVYRLIADRLASGRRTA